MGLNKCREDIFFLLHKFGDITGVYKVSVLVIVFKVNHIATKRVLHIV